MKGFHWGHGLIIFFILYIGYLVGTVIKSRSINHNLVVDDYYAHDLAYQKMYVDASTNRQLLDADLVIEGQFQTNLNNFGKLRWTVSPLQTTVDFLDLTLQIECDRIIVSTLALIHGFKCQVRKPSLGLFRRNDFRPTETWFCRRLSRRKTMQ